MQKADIYFTVKVCDKQLTDALALTLNFVKLQTFIQYFIRGCISFISSLLWAHQKKKKKHDSNGSESC